MSRDLNSIRFTGSIFWSKLSQQINFSTLRLGVKLNNGISVFCLVTNPKITDYDITKTGNKILLSNGFLDTWIKDDSTKELQIKSYSSGVDFFKKEALLPDINDITILGKIIEQDGELITINIIGDKNPKTNQWSNRFIDIKIPKIADNLQGKRIFFKGFITSEDMGNHKTRMSISADYDKILII